MDDHSDVKLGAKVGKDPQELTVGDVWNSMSIEKKPCSSIVLTEMGEPKKLGTA